MAFFYEIFDASLPRLGPGEEKSTRRALDILLSQKTDQKPLQALDVGCGTGAQTLVLARHMRGSILAVDNHSPYLEELQIRAEEAGLADRITTRCTDMAAFNKESDHSDLAHFDLIWSEGALYSMGFREGLVMCRSLLAPYGLMAVSELTWLQPGAPATCRNYVTKEYPAITDQTGNQQAIEDSGLNVVDTFILPESAWWEPFYLPLEKRIREMGEKLCDHDDRRILLKEVETEISNYRRFARYYGYVFYLMQRTD